MDEVVETTGLRLQHLTVAVRDGCGQSRHQVPSASRWDNVIIYH